jgi:hypothetical protein
MVGSGILCISKVLFLSELKVLICKQKSLHDLTDWGLNPEPFA